MAKQIYPLVTEYIDQKKPMDKNFIDSYINLYEVNFPEWINELNNIMSYRYVLTENKEDINAIRKMYRYRSRTEEEYQITKSSIEKMKTTSLTKVIVISKNSAEKIKLLKNEFPELKNWNPNANKEFANMILLNDKSQLIVLNQKTATIETLFKSIK